MSELAINIPDTLNQQLYNIAKEINESPEDILLKALACYITYYQQLKQLNVSPISNQLQEERNCLKEIASYAMDLGVTDLAENHDHYLYGI